MRFECNLNDEILVKLTPAGEDEYDLNYRTEPRNESGVYRFKIWDFMNVFGHKLYLGSTIQYIENNKLVIIKNETEDSVGFTY